jgi:RNA polymerase sigma-70 factor (ECF subfamily)
VTDIRRFQTVPQARPNMRLPVDMTEDEVNQLFASCLPKLNKSARKMLANPQDSEDAVQEALLLAFRKLHQFEGRSSFSTWLHSIVRNTSRMYYRRAQAHPSISMDQEWDSETHSSVVHDFPDTQPTPEEHCIQQERSQILRKATNDLPERYHAAIYLFYMQGLGEEATARALGMSVSALKAQLHRSRILLNCRIRQACVPAARAEFLYRRPVLFMRERRAGRIRRHSKAR